MRTIALGCVLAACSGMRPALDHVGPAIADYEGRWAEPEKRVRYLGEGCYVVRDERVYACSIEPTLTGPLCVQEPVEYGVAELAINTDGDWNTEPGFIQAGRSPHVMHVEGFLEELDTPRCHRRWYDTLDVAPTAVDVRDVGGVPLAQLGVQVAAQVVFDRSAIVEVCRGKIDADRIRARVCRNGSRLTVMRTDQSYDSEKVALRQSLEDALRTSVLLEPAPSSPKCSFVEVSVADLKCRSTLDRVTTSRRTDRHARARA